MEIEDSKNVSINTSIIILLNQSYYRLNNTIPLKHSRMKQKQMMQRLNKLKKTRKSMKKKKKKEKRKKRLMQID